MDRVAVDDLVTDPLALPVIRCARPPHVRLDEGASVLDRAVVRGRLVLADGRGALPEDVARHRPLAPDTLAPRP